MKKYICGFQSQLIFSSSVFLPCCIICSSFFFFLSFFLCLVSWPFLPIFRTDGTRFQKFLEAAPPWIGATSRRRIWSTLSERWTGHRRRGLYRNSSPDSLCLDPIPNGVAASNAISTSTTLIAIAIYSSLLFFVLLCFSFSSVFDFSRIESNRIVLVIC